MSIKLAILSTAFGGALASPTVPAPTLFSSVTAGQGFSCGVHDDTGRVECWGDGAFGDPPSLDVLEGRLMDENHLSISGGGFHVCGLYYNGKERPMAVEAYCVASFEDGDPRDAEQLDIPDLEEGNYWTGMSAGGQHSCGIDRFRKVHCWGLDAGNRRALGEYAMMEHRHISAGGLATCGVLLDNTGYCVGDVPQGTLPAEYASTKFTMLEAGGAFTYGLTKATKELIKFGPGEAARDPFLIVESIPTMPPSGFQPTMTLTIAAGAAHVCATGRRDAEAISQGLPVVGTWCGGTGGHEVTDIPTETV